MKEFRMLLICLLLLSLWACQLPVIRDAAFSPPEVKEDIKTKNYREKVVEGAYHLVKTQNLTVRGKRFSPDCSGTVLAIYYYAGIDLTREYHLFKGGGVERIYATLEKYNLLHKETFPQPGDIVFWDNTYDRNGDKRWNDELTHVAVVVAVTPDGDIDYVHYHYTQGIIIEKMNLKHRETHTRKGSGGAPVVVNSPMRMKSQNWDNTRWLASHLFRTFGRGYYLGSLW